MAKQQQTREAADGKDTTGTKASEAVKFHSAFQISQALQSSDVHSLKEVCIAIRNQFTLRANEYPINPLDGRFLLAKSYSEQSLGLPELCNLFGAFPSNFDILALGLAILTNVLIVLSSHPDGHGSAAPLIKSLFAPHLQRRFRGYLDGSQNDLILGTLKLFKALANFAGGKEQKQVLENFPWNVKSLPKLLFMRRKGRNTESTDLLIRPDIRTLYIQYLLSFVSENSATATKTAFLEAHRDIFTAIFKGISQDPYPVARYILETCWTGIWSDAKLSRSLKIGMFQESTFQRLFKLYERTSPEDPADSESVPADLVHHFILGLTTKPGFGICFKDRGWYPRQLEGTDPDLEGMKTKQHKGRIFNKILSNVLKNLKVNEDPRQNELGLRILETCPELVAGFWQAASLTLEPRLSYKWMVNIAFVGSVISQPIPESSFHIISSAASPSRGGSTAEYNPTPPPLRTIIENILPGALGRAFLTKGIQHTSPLVQHTTAMLLIKCLMKFEKVVGLMRRISSHLQEDKEWGLWFSRSLEVEQEISKRLPDYRSIVNFAQRCQSLSLIEEPKDVATEGKAAKAKGSVDPRDTETLDVLSEAALRLVSLCYRCIPDITMEVKFDSGKLLTLLEDSTTDDGGFGRLRQLHILRLLKDDPQFVWSNKASGSPLTYTGQLLLLIRKSRSKVLKRNTSTTISALLSQSVLFEHDPDEVVVWIEALPLPIEHTADTGSSGNSMRVDDGDDIIMFIDSCLQRCLKTPYRYLEESIRLSRPAADEATSTDHRNPYSPHQLPSPLFMTVLEQLSVRMRQQVDFTPPAAIVAFVCRLTVLILGKQPDLHFVKMVCARLREMLKRGTDEPSNSPHSFCSRQVDLLQARIFNLEEFRVEPSDIFPSTSDIPNANSSSTTLHCTFNNPHTFIPNSRPQHQASSVTAFDRESLDASIEILFSGDVTSNDKISEYLRSQAVFEDVITLADHSWFTRNERKIVLSELLFKEPRDLAHLQRRVGLLCHHLRKAEGLADREQLIEPVLNLLATIFSVRTTPDDIKDELKLFLFREQAIVDRILTSEHGSTNLQQAIQSFVISALSPGSSLDRELASKYCVNWISKLLAKDIDLSLSFCAQCWVPYMHSADLLQLLSHYLLKYQTRGSFDQSSENEFIGIVCKSLLGFLNDSGVLHEILPFIKSLLQLSQTLSLEPIETLLEAIIARVLPPCIDGISSNGPIARASETYEWTPSGVSLPSEVILSVWPQSSDWTLDRDRIVGHALYSSEQLRNEYCIWYNSGNQFGILGNKIMFSFHAFTDSCLSCSQNLLNLEQLCDSLSWVLALYGVQTRLDAKYLSHLHQATLTSLLGLVAQSSSFESKDFISKLKLSHIKDVKCLELLLRGLHDSRAFVNPKWTDITSILADQAIQSLTRSYSESSELSDYNDLHAFLGCFLKIVQVASHLAEPFLQSILKSRLDSGQALLLGTSVVKNSPLKPASTNKILQSVVNNPLFGQVARSPARDCLVAFLDALFRKFPQNTCQASHAAPLVHIYGGSLSKADRQLLAIFALFEQERHISVASLLSKWTPIKMILAKSTNSTKDTICSLDPSMVFRSCYQLRSFQHQDSNVSTEWGDQLTTAYDPQLLVGFVSQLMSQSLDLKSIEWVELFRTNIFSLIICCLSVKDRNVRGIARAILGSVSQDLENVVFQEKHQVVYLLDMIQGSQSSTIEGSRLPYYVTLFLAHALRGIFFPASFVYPHTARYLLQRPELDLTDVPMFLGLIFSSSDNWKKERIWMLRFVRDGLKSSRDWKIFRRRHIFELISSYLDASEPGSVTRTTILEIILEIMHHGSAAVTLIARHAWLSWAEIQLTLLQTKEDASMWAKIISQMLSVLDFDLVDRLAGPSWRADAMRCIQILMQEKISLEDLSSLSQSLYRLGESECRDSVFQCLKTAITSLTFFEGSISLSASSNQISKDHRTWAITVAQLWRTSMLLPQATKAWDTLTCRMLIWRAISQERGVYEWVRLQVVSSYSS